MNHSIDIYLDHFALRERPFSLVPDPDFLFWSPGHRRAFSMFEYGIMTRAPITLITGEIGAGKTTLLHHLLQSLGDDLTVGMIANAHGTREELLRWVLQALDQEVSDTAGYVAMFGQFEAFLIAEYAAGRRVVLIFDEAQNLGREALEELRMLTNINANKDELLQLVLVGQPELRDIVRQPGLSQFAQRVASNFHLEALNQEAVRDYIAHRLEKAGATGELFSATATELIYGATKGVPRLINQLCDLSLLYAYTDDQKKVTGAVVQQVLDDGVFFGGGAQPAGGGQTKLAAIPGVEVLDAAGLADYLNQRVTRAGGQRDVFSTAALEIIHASTRGLPVLVDQLCDMCLLYAYTDDQTKVGRAIVEQVLEDGAFPGAAPAGVDPPKTGGDAGKPIPRVKQVK